MKKKTLKKAIALLIGVCLTVNIMLLPVSALGAGVLPVVELIELFGPLLVGTGAYTQSEVNDMSWSEFDTSLNQAISDGSISADSLNSSEYTWSFSDGTEYTGSFFSLFTNPVTTAQLMGEMSDTTTLALDVIKTYLKVEMAADDVIPTVTGSSFDMQGYPCVLYKETNDGYFKYWYYGTSGEFYNSTDTSYKYHINYDYYIRYYDGEYKTYDNSSSLGSTYYYGTSSAIFYGTWTWRDTGEVDTTNVTTSEAEETAVVGTSVDTGEAVTLDQIQSGEVDVDDVDLDYTKFDDTAIIDLLSDILAAVESVPVVDTSDTAVDSTITDTVVDVSALELEALENFQIPNAIVTVFPFCIPWDFVRGMKLFSAEPETPHFEANITVPAFLNVPEQKWDFVIDLKEFEPVAKVSRWLSMVSFSYVLIMLTSKIVKSGGS